MPPIENKSNKNALILIVIFIALIVVVYLMYSAGTKAPVQTKESKESVNYQSINIAAAKTDADKVPKGMPQVPLETKNIISSDTKVYSDRNPVVTLYTVNIQSDATVEKSYNFYLDFMTKEKYSFGTNGKDEKNHALYGIKGSDSLLVVSSDQNGKTLVQIVYTKVGN